MKIYKTIDCTTGREMYHSRNQEAQRPWNIYKQEGALYEVFNGDVNCGVWPSLGEALAEVERVEAIVKAAKK